MDAIALAEIVRRHIQQAQKRGAEVWQDDRLTRLRRESELPSWSTSLAEAIFAVWWHHLTAALYTDFGDLASLQPQMPVVLDGREHRVEFAVTPADPFLNQVAELKHIASPRIAVTLEGDDEGTGTGEPAGGADERDHALRSAGWTVFHFSASELQHSPEGCVREVMDAAKPLLETFRRRAMREAFAALHATARADGGS